MAADHRSVVTRGVPIDTSALADINASRPELGFQTILGEDVFDFFGTDPLAISQQGPLLTNPPTVSPPPPQNARPRPSPPPPPEPQRQQTEANMSKYVSARVAPDPAYDPDVLDSLAIDDPEPVRKKETVARRKVVMSQPRDKVLFDFDWDKDDKDKQGMKKEKAKKVSKVLKKYCVCCFWLRKNWKRLNSAIPWMMQADIDMMKKLHGNPMAQYFRFLRFVVYMNWAVCAAWVPTFAYMFYLGIINGKYLLVGKSYWLPAWMYYSQLNPDADGSSFDTISFSLVSASLGFTYIFVTIALLLRLMWAYHHELPKLLHDLDFGGLHLSLAVFNGWDYQRSCAPNMRNAVERERKALVFQFKNLLSRAPAIRKARWAGRFHMRVLHWLELAARRIATFVVGAILVVAGSILIGGLFYGQTLWQETFVFSEMDEYLVAIAMFALTYLFRVMFWPMSTFEKFESPYIRMKYTMWRAYFSQLVLLLGVVAVFWYFTVKGSTAYENANTLSEEGYHCPEDQLGMQYFRIVLVDWFLSILLCVPLFFHYKTVPWLRGQTMKPIVFNYQREAMRIAYLQLVIICALPWAPLLGILSPLLFYFTFKYQQYFCRYYYVKPVEDQSTRMSLLFFEKYMMWTLVFTVAYNLNWIVRYNQTDWRTSAYCGPFDSTDLHELVYNLMTTYSVSEIYDDILANPVILWTLIVLLLTWTLIHRDGVALSQRHIERGKHRKILHDKIRNLRKELQALQPYEKSNDDDLAAETEALRAEVAVYRSVLDADTSKYYGTDLHIPIPLLELRRKEAERNNQVDTMRHPDGKPLWPERPPSADLDTSKGKSLDEDGNGEGVSIRGTEPTPPTLPKRRAGQTRSGQWREVKRAAPTTYFTTPGNEDAIL